MSDVTRWSNDSGEHPDAEMFARLYGELKKIARTRMQGERQGHTLNPTAVVHEAWMRVEKSDPEEWRNEGIAFRVLCEDRRP